MRQSIKTKYLGPSNVRGARVKASSDAGSVTLPWNHALGIEDNHAAALRDRYRRVNGIADKPQTFDLSPLPLFGDAHKQKELF